MASQARWPKTPEWQEEQIQTIGDWAYQVSLHDDDFDIVGDPVADLEEGHEASVWIRVSKADVEAAGVQDWQSLGVRQWDHGGGRANL